MTKSGSRKAVGLGIRLLDGTILLTLYYYYYYYMIYIAQISRI